MPRSRSRSRHRSLSRGRRSRSRGRRSHSRHRSPRNRIPPPRYHSLNDRRPRRRSSSRDARNRDLRNRIRRSPSRERLTSDRSRHHAMHSQDKSHHRSLRDVSPKLIPSRQVDRHRSRSPHTSSGSSSKPKKELGYTGRALNERFTNKYNPLDFQPSENISVAIERNIKGTKEARLDFPFDVSLVRIPRRKNEGEVPLTTREEFKTREEEEEIEEKRIITVKGSSLENKRLLDKLDRQYGRPGSGRDNFEIRRDEHSSDLRHRLGRRKDSNWKEEVMTGSDRRKIDTGRFEGRISSRIGDQPRSGERSDGPLPDFSSRPDKYNTSWQDDPSMIPTSGLYFEHDTRDNPEYNSRGERRIRGGRGRGLEGGDRGRLERGDRGRGRFLGRGGFRGRGRGDSFQRRGRGGRGRGRGWRPAYEPEWKHDKFEENEQGGSDGEKKSQREVRKDEKEFIKETKMEDNSNENEHLCEEPTSTT